MKKITKRIMALMLSLVMILGCVPSFINEASALDPISTTMDVILSKADNFPTSREDAWMNENGCLAFLDNGKLIFDNFKGKTYSITPNGTTVISYDGGKSYENSFDPTFYLNITNDKLTSFTCTKSNYTDQYPEFKGKYGERIYNITGTITGTLSKSVDDVVLAVPDGAPYTIKSVSEKWYKTYESYELKDEATEIEENKLYYKKLVLEPKEGYVFNNRKFDMTCSIDVMEPGNPNRLGTATTDWNTEISSFWIVVWSEGKKDPEVITEDVEIVPNSGSLEIESAPTLTFKEKENNDYFTVEDTDKWYETFNDTTDELSNEVTSNISEKGKKLYKKIKLKAKQGYRFDNPTINVPDTITKEKVINDGANVILILSKETEGKSVNVNYPTVTSLTDLLELDDTDFTTTGAKSYDFNLEWLTDLTHDMTLGGQILLRHEFDIQTTEEAEKVENVYLNGIKITDTYKIDSSELDTFMKDHDFAYFIQNQFVTLYEKFDFGVDYSANFTVAPGTTIGALEQSFTSNFNVSPDIWVYEMNGGDRNDRPLLESDTLVAGKTYCVHIDVDSKYDVNAIKTLTVNNVSLPRYGSLEGRLHAYEVGWPFENMYYISCYYVFDCKNQSSGGGSRKKKTPKTEEPKPEEPQKTPEEKLKEELLKDDVKKANSNEGEKINPSAKFINGYDDGTFKAERKVNNIELMSMVTELFDNVEIKETKDLNQGENYWGQEIIDKANALGLVPGNKDDKNYNLTDEVTRGDLAVVVYNLVKDFSNAPSLKDRDNCKDAIGTGYEKEAAKLLELGIFKGYDDGLFHGDYTLTRAEAVVVINRALKSLGFEINMPKISLSFPDLDPSHWAYAEIMYASNK